MRKYTVNIKDKEYDLALTRDSIKWLGNYGFDLENFGNKIINNIDLLWCAGFMAYHKDVNPNLAMKLMESYKEEDGDVMDAINFLAEEYTAFMDAQTATSSNMKKGKITEI